MADCPGMRPCSTRGGLALPERRDYFNSISHEEIEWGNGGAPRHLTSKLRSNSDLQGRSKAAGQGELGVRQQDVLTSRADELTPAAAGKLGNSEGFRERAGRAFQVERLK
jgi:hypothetical protein